MNYDMCKFERGQVWMVRFKHQESVGHEQDKDRPWLVLSVGRFNKSSGLMTMVPITTRDKTSTPTQVLFTNNRGVSNVILCEQIRTFDHTSGAYIFDFMGNISDEILEKVDVAISIHLGLHYSPITLNKLYDSMEAIIKSVGYMQEKANTPKFTDDDILQFAEKLESLTINTRESTHKNIIEEMDKAYGIPVDDEVAATRVEVSTTEHIESNTSSQDTTNNVEVKTKRNKWTPEKCKEFIHDTETLPMKAVMEKWSISKKTRFYSMKNYVATLLEKMN